MKQPDSERLPIARNLALILANSVLASIFFWATGASMIAGRYLSLYVAELSESNWVRSMVPALWSAAALTSLFASYISERLRRDRMLSIVSLPAMSAVAIVAGVVPALLGPRGSAPVVVLFAGLFLANILSNVYFFTLFAWFPSLFGERMMGRLQAARMLVFSGAGALVMPLAGAWLEAHPGVSGFAWLYGGAGVCGMLAAVPLLFARGAPTEHPPHERFFQGTRSLFSDRNFRVFLGLALVLNLAPILTGAFENIFVRDTLKFSYKQFGFVNMLAPLAGLVTVLAWGRLADTLGARLAVLIGMLGYIAWPALMATCAPGHVALVYPAYLLAGGLGSAYGVGWVSLMYALSPRHKRATAMGLVWIACAGSGVIAPFLGGALVEGLGSFTFRIGGRVFGAINVLLMVQTLVALCAIPFFLALRPPGHASTRDALALFARRPLRALWLAVLGDHLLELIRRARSRPRRP